MHNKENYFVGNSKVTVGHYTYGYKNLQIKQWGEGASLTIGAFCSIASNITIFLGGNHRVDWVSTFPFGHIFKDELGFSTFPGHPATNGNVNIGNDVWIGHGVSIMSGISVGDGAVIAANSHVTKNVNPYEIVGGNPARFLKNRFDEEITQLLLKLQWWNLPLEVVRNITHILCDKPKKSDLLDLLSKYKN